QPAPGSGNRRREACRQMVLPRASAPGKRKERVMSEWKPIETAPGGVPVRVGKWEFWGGKNEWKENEGVAWRPRLFGLFRHYQYVGREYHYWKPLPPPPSS